MNRRPDQYIRHSLNLLSRTLILSTIVVSGCVRFEPKSISPSETMARLEDRGLTNEALKIFVQKQLGRDLPVWPTTYWDFEMLTLAAFFWHPGLEVARAQWGSARAGEKTAGQRPNPTLNVAPGYNSTTAMASPWLPLTSLDIPLETAGKRKHRQAHAASIAEAARVNVVTVAWQLRSSLRSHLLAYQASEEREKLLTKQIELQEQIVKAFEQQMKAGAVAGAELFPVRIGLIKLRLDLAEAERSRAEDKARLAEDLGVPLLALKDIQFGPLTHTEQQIAGLALDQFRSTALQSRADILGSLAEYAAAQSALQLEIAKQYPDVHLQPGYQFDQGDNKWSLGLLVELPILNQNQGPIAEAKARRDEAAAKFVALQARVLAEIDRAAEVLRVTQRTVGTLRALAGAQAQRRDSVAAQLKAGSIDQLELLNAESEYVAAQLVQVDGQMRLEQAVGTLEDALQVRFDVPSAVFKSFVTGEH
jgi:outer membrane protein TolC